MSGKHGRKAGRGGDVIDALETSVDAPSVATPSAPSSPIIVSYSSGIAYAPEPRTPPTPPSLPPIRTSPLPEFAAPEPQIEAVAPVIEPPVIEPPVVEAPAPVTEAPAPVVDAPAPAIEAPAPVVDAPAPVIEAPVIEAPAPPEPERQPEAVPVLPSPQAFASEPVAAPALAAAPILPGDPILPIGFGARDAAHEDRSRRRRLVMAAIAAVIVLALLGWVAFSGSSKAPKHVAAGPVSRTQSTLLIQVSGGLGAAADSALVAHDSSAHTGVVVLIPGDVITQVPGFGPMSFAQSLSVGDPSAPRLALSDLIGVTIDGSWTLTPTALGMLVDKLGGVTVTVDRDVTKTAADGTVTIVVPAGNRRLDGAAAAAFATFIASGETEQARLARFNAVFQQVLAQLPTRQADLTTLLAGLGTGSVSSFALPRLGLLLTGLASDNGSNNLTDQVLPVTELDTGGDTPSSTIDTQATTTLVNGQLAASVPVARTGTGNRVYVQNQVGTPGLDESTRTKLASAGFVYLPGDNTEDMPNSTSLSAVVIFGSTAADITRGDAVATALGLPISDVKLSDVGVTVADVVVKLGVDYKQ